MAENLINDLLDLAKLENNSFNISTEYFDLPITIFRTLQMLQISASDNNISLEASIDS